VTGDGKGMVSEPDPTAPAPELTNAIATDYSRAPCQEQ
jgi:hypothetical protein